MQPHWNPRKVNEIVMDGMPVCSNHKGPIQEFFGKYKIGTIRPSQLGHPLQQGQLRVGEYSPYAWYNDLDPYHYYRPQPKVKENFGGTSLSGLSGLSGCSLCSAIRWVGLLILVWYLYKRFI